MAAGGAAAAYTAYHAERAPFTRRWRVMGMSAEREMELGRRAYDELLQSVRPAVLAADDARTRRARRVVTRLVRASRRLDARLGGGFRWSVAVWEEAAPNAVCVPGGRMAVTTGLLRLCEREEELAMVLAHEMAHALNRHAAEKVQLQMAAAMGVLAVRALLGWPGAPGVAAARLLLELPYGRRLEREADSVGLIVMTEACYDPRHGAAVFDKLAAATGEHDGDARWAWRALRAMVSTHPMSTQRAAQLRREARALTARFDNKCGAFASMRGAIA